MTSEADDATPAAVATAVSAVVALLYGLFAWLQWTALVSPSWDLGIFAQLAKAYAAGEAPIVPIKGEGFNLLGDHFHPLLVLLGPLWALWPSPLALLWFQALLFAVATWPLTRLAAGRFGPWFAALFGLGLGLSWGLQSAVAAQFHEIALAVPLLAFALASFLRGDLLRTALWAAPLVFVKEDLGLTVAALGLVMAWRHRERRGGPALGVGLAVWGVTWTVLAVTVLLPAVNPYDHYDYTDRLIGLLTPFTPAEKWWTVLMLVATAGVVGLRSPLALLLLPTLAWRFAGDVPQYWGWQWHYSAILMPVAFAALLDALPEGAGRAARRWRGVALATALGVTAVLGPDLPLATLVRPSSYDRTWRWEPAQEVIAAIPDGATVETDLTLMAYLVPTATVYWVGTINPVPDYVLLDDYSPVWGGSPPPADPAAWASERYGVPFEFVLETGGFRLARRVSG